MHHAFNLTLPALAISICSLSFSQFVQAEKPPLSQNYQEPTRGFLIENGMVSGLGRVSAELYAGSGNQSSGGGIRLGLPRAELILNSRSNGNNQNDAVLKWKMPDYKPNNVTEHRVKWSAIAGISQFDQGSDDSLSFQFGAAASLEADAGLFTISPLIVHTDRNGADDTFFGLGLGAHVGVIDTMSGLFSLGAEAIITSQDDGDNMLALGVRWAYNARVNIDIIPVMLGDEDMTGIPGQVKLNIVF